ncbi:MAG: polysaccharide deacetylase family protein [Armatimonadetes bacterium]|nr:polysaccharide deacetylase family protein [Armatimonadota bacterium]
MRRTRKSCLPGCIKYTAGLLLLATVGFGAAYFLSQNRRELPKRFPTAPQHAPSTRTQPTAPAWEQTPSRHKPPKPSEAKQTAKAENPVSHPSVDSASKESEASTRKPPKPTITSKEQWNEVSHGSRTKPLIALTFDAGADSSPTHEILNVLAKHNLHCTFFLTGKWIERNPELTRRIATEGHEIGNHTYSHRSLPELSEGEIVNELARVDDLVTRLTGLSTKPLARVPYGSRDKRVLRILAENGYRSIYWDVDSWDAFKRGITANEICQRVLSHVQNGSIVLMHCGSKATAEALDSMIETLQSSGYQIVTVSELIGI